MLDDDLIKQLKDIAYCDIAKPADRHQAFTTLYRNGYNPGEILEALEPLAIDLAIPDKYRVRIIQLIAQITKDIGNTKKQIAIDEINVKNALLEQYCGQS
jgi:hypothetical protein